MMNKIFISLTLLLLAALAVTACTSAPTVAPAPTGGANLPTSTTSAGIPATGPGTGTPLATASGSATGAATTAATSAVPLATSSATTAATTAATMAATTAATSAPTSNVSTAAAPAVTGSATVAPTTSAGTSGTPVAGLPSQFVRLSILLKSNLVTGNQNGQITGVVITQPTAQSGATATPTADQLVPYVRYVVVDFGGSTSNELLLPFQMFSFSPAVTTANGVSQNFTLKGTAASRNSAPRVSLPANTGALSSGWDSQASQYWASQGFTIPVTGTTSLATGQDVLLRNTINGANIVDQKNQALGQVSDFLLDPNTGQFEYAVFNGGQLFGNRLFIVPVRNLIFQFSSASAAGLGNIQLNVPSTLLNTAPFITSLNQIPLDPNLLQQFNNFWQSIQK